MTSPSSPITHDYTERTWGHDFVVHKIWNEGRTLDVSGWGEGIEKDHFLILPNHGSTTRYVVTEINYRYDPPDMWHARLVFAPRLP